ncbi:MULTISPECIES: TRAP transporter large permease subunit [unclassified Modicisalibacter]|uniref:TRAP transporter large permease n=1 Tax=unclassified Modicisalibacter TaxID=2679913 RepID=UPI001CCF877E|nr:MULTISPECIES: TRAP transporter large permease subunit [unclassified Modicisalibacter]MBZ9559666.1 TRAP transporter large permease subunit [Modicisalibacter sp. R2A 31.J]MBZ9577118.1 TRAP transporter large permease subunit [Modicisalibacter sp. MOD 31.J]
MDMLLTGAGVIALLLGVLALGNWVFSGLVIVAMLSLWGLGDFDAQRIGLILSKILFRAANSWELSAIPLFILMGELIFRSDISERLFRGLTPLTRHLPGGILHTNVLGCTLFAAVSGSSAATTATVGKITTQELARRHYDRDLSIGSLAGAGSLGLLIPPSIVMIVYGVQAEVSISKLFMAGVLPGLLIAALYVGYVALRSLLDPRVAPRGEDDATGIGRALLDLAPVLGLIVIVLGAIYSGIATPSEAAAVGCAATLALLLWERQLSLALFVDALRGALISAVMVCSLLIAAALLSTAMGYLHLPSELAGWIAAQGFSPVALLLALALFYIVLGLFLDGISITVMSLPITLPIIVQAGYDPLWFGVFLVIMVELGQITPPVGFNLFVLQGLTGESIGRVALAAAPFFVLMCIGALIVCLWPAIALWLPTVLSG